MRLSDAAIFEVALPTVTPKIFPRVVTSSVVVVSSKATETESDETFRILKPALRACETTSSALTPETVTVSKVLELTAPPFAAMAARSDSAKP